jgi:hypothetical protein
VTATIWRTCPSCLGSFEQPDDPGRIASDAPRPSSRPPTAPVNAPAPASATAAKSGARSRISSAASAPALNSPAPASDSTGASPATPAAPTATRQRQRPPARRQQQRCAGAHRAHYRRPAAQGRCHQLPARGGRLPGEGRGRARQSTACSTNPHALTGDWPVRACGSGRQPRPAPRRF